MTWNRYARKADATTQQIVDELRAVGYVVEHVGRPVDIAVRHPTWPAGRFVFMECKTPEGKNGQVWHRSRMSKQQRFCADNGVPYVRSGFEALEFLGERKSA